MYTAHGLALQVHPDASGISLDQVDKYYYNGDRKLVLNKTRAEKQQRNRDVAMERDMHLDRDRELASGDELGGDIETPFRGFGGTSHSPFSAGSTASPPFGRPSFSQSSFTASARSPSSGGRAGGRTGVGDIDETGQGLREAHTRRVDRVKRRLTEPATDDPRKLLKALIVTEGVGKTDGKELASYLVEEQTRLSFIQQMGGPLAFLEAQEKKVTRHWSKAVLLEAKRMLPLLSDALKSEDELDFGEPEEADDELDFGAAVGTSTAGACAPASRAIDPSSSSLAAQRSALWDHALPPRHGSVAKTAASRAALRDTFRIASLRTAEWAAAAEAEARARDSSLAIRSSTRAPVRGRVLPVSQLAGGLRAAERRMRLFTLRPDRPPELEEPAGSRPIDRGFVWETHMSRLSRRCP